MKLRVRTLQNVEKNVEAVETETVLDLKKNVEREFGNNMPAERQKLIHNGKILVDDKLVSEYPDIKNGERVVVIVTKTSAPKPVAETPATTENTTNNTNNYNANNNNNNNTNNIATGTTLPTPTTESPINTENTTINTENDTNTNDNNNTINTDNITTENCTISTTEAPASYTDAASTLITGSQLQETIARITAMGFEPGQVQAAMRAAFNNPDRAVEYLFNGIPSQEVQQTPEPVAAPRAHVEENMATEGNPLETLRAHPQFGQIRQMIQSNPSMLPQVLEIIGQSNPQLLEAINDNPHNFMEVLQSEGGDRAAPNPETTGVVEIPMTDTEIQSLDRLGALGFSRQAVQEAFLACDRNEEMAANYLFENSADFGDTGF